MKQLPTTIWKFPLKPDRQEGQAAICIIEMPRGAEVLTASSQTGESCLWALVDPEAPTEKRKFYVVGTGFKLPVALGKLYYLGTFFVADAMVGMPPILVFHVFEDR